MQQSDCKELFPEDDLSGAGSNSRPPAHAHRTESRGPAQPHDGYSLRQAMESTREAVAGGMQLGNTGCST